jgi:hypothetical protein
MREHLIGKYSIEIFGVGGSGGLLMEHGASNGRTSLECLLQHARKFG